MKIIIKIATLFCFLVFTIHASAQVKGNGNIVTKIFPLENFDFIKLNLTTDLYIDLNQKNSISITADENLIDLIKQKVRGKSLTLDQKEWIAPSKQIVIRIGVNQLRGINCGAHSLVKIEDINQASFKVKANVGRIILSGKVASLKVENEVAKVDASELIAAEAKISISSWGSVIANVTEVIDTDIDKNGQLVLVNEPETLRGDAKEVFTENLKEPENVKWIKFKIKNNSLSRKNFYVVGPKKDGSRFSYGFPMMPGATRNEDWTVGSKIYKVSKLGLRKLLVTIKAEDENQTVKLFK